MAAYLLSLRSLVAGSALALGLAAAGCAAEEAEQATDVDELTKCSEGETRCAGDAVETCGGNKRFGKAIACTGDAVCRSGACAEPTATQRAQATELASMLSYVKDNTAWHSPLDWTKFREEGQREIFRGDGSEKAYFGALFHAFIQVPQGHQGLYPEGCGRSIAYTGYVKRGACGRPHEKGIIVTSTKAKNALGLNKGDVITRIGSGAKAVEGDSILTALADRPVCTASRPSVSFRDASTAVSFADLLEPGEVITVRSPDGKTREVTVPADTANANLFGVLECSDPFSRPVVPAEATVRPDGVAVIRLPSFVDPEVPFPQNPTQESYEAYAAQFKAKIHAELQKVKNAPAIVWDLRGNGGGVTAVGLAIASGFPGARTGSFSYCLGHVPGSDPPQNYPERGAEYALTPGGDFAYAGKVAVLIDGMNYSAADYFPLAIKQRTSALLVGTPTAGGYGATMDSREFAGPPSFTVAIDTNHCVSVDDGKPLEGRSVAPHVTVGYEASDLAAGRDTVLERAIAELRK